MFAVLFWLIAFTATGVAIGSFARLFQRRTVAWTDGALFVAPFVLWLVLVMVGWRAKSLGNLVEPMVLFLILCASVGVRTFALRWGENAQRSVGALIVGVASSFLLYALVPSLPE